MAIPEEIHIGVRINDRNAIKCLIGDKLSYQLLDLIITEISDFIGIYDISYYPKVVILLFINIQY